MEQQGGRRQGPEGRALRAYALAVASCAAAYATLAQLVPAAHPAVLVVAAMLTVAALCSIAARVSDSLRR